MSEAQPQDAPGGAGPAPSGESAAQPVAFAPLPAAESGAAAAGGEPGGANLELILDVSVPITVEVGRTTMKIEEILTLGPGAVVELDKLAGEPLDLYVNGKRIARGEVVLVNDSLGVRITEIGAPASRLGGLGQ
ncbi:MAG: flagellar motor switch protein FliN [Planctomycetota bacterium]|nr:MAG: flagellar motor switch protein FliN [Planctomycetota bacterium]